MWFSWSALMQLPNASNDLLILAPSIIRCPLLLVRDARSDPAKSIMLSFPTCSSPWSPARLSVYSHTICNTAWERDEVALAPVASTVLLRLPCSRSERISSAEKTSRSVMLAICTPFIGSSRRSKYCWFCYCSSISLCLLPNWGDYCDTVSAIKSLICSL